MFLLRAISKTVFWSYRRGSWQHEFLCLAFIAALIFVPTNSNGWFYEGQEVELDDGGIVSLHRLDTTLYLTWDEDGPEPDEKAVQKKIEEIFGEDAKAIKETIRGQGRYRIIPRGLK